jgi:hypothetical protein
MVRQRKIRGKITYIETGHSFVLIL